MPPSAGRAIRRLVKTMRELANLRTYVQQLQGSSRSLKRIIKLRTSSQGG